MVVLHQGPLFTQGPPWLFPLWVGARDAAKHWSKKKKNQLTNVKIQLALFNNSYSGNLPSNGQWYRMEGCYRQKLGQDKEVISKRKERVVTCKVNGRSKGSYHADDLTGAHQEILD